MKYVFFHLLLLSCSSIQKIDRPICVELNMAKGFCTTIISGKDQVVDETNLLDGKTWFEARNEMILVPIETWVALKTYIITECKRTKRCGSDIQTWERSIQGVDSKIEDKLSERKKQDYPSSSQNQDTSNKFDK